MLLRKLAYFTNYLRWQILFASFLPLVASAFTVYAIATVSIVDEDVPSIIVTSTLIIWFSLLIGLVPIIQQLVNKKSRNSNIVQGKNQIIGNWTYDFSSHEMVWSEEMFDIFSRQRESFQVTRSTYLRCIHKEDRSNLKSVYTNALENQKSYHITYRIDTDEDELKYVNERCIISYNEDGTPESAHATVVDITDLHTLEDDLKQTESDYKAIVENAPYAIFISDNLGNLATVNKASSTITGYTQEELSSMNYVDFLPKRWISNAVRNFAELQAKGSVSLEIPFVRKDGTEGISAITALRLDKNRLIGFNKDISDEKRIKEQLHQTEKIQVIGQLAGGIAHDFNNQLGAILGYTELLKNEILNESPQLLEYTEQIEKGIHNATKSTSQLLAFSQNGKVSSDILNINDTVTSVSELLQSSIDKRITVNCDITNEPATTIGDKKQLRDALLNIAINASEAISSTGTVEIATSVVSLSDENSIGIEAGKYIAISVKDSGKGIPEVEKEHIFEPFYSTKENGGGSGMGLTASNSIIRSHNGVITVNSYTNGTNVTIYLPYTDAVQVTKGKSPQITSAPHKSASIMIIDDEPALRAVVSKMVQSKGYDAIAFSDGLEAIDYLEANPGTIGLVVLDLMMPIISGADTFKELQRLDPDIKVLIASGYSIEGDAQELLDLGVKGFIQKPFSTENLLLDVHRILEGNAPFNESSEGE